MYFGAQYYRPPFPVNSCWERDLKHMRSLGFNTIKLWAVWNDIERRPGEYSFDDLDKLVEIAGRNNLQVIINTIPEGAPAWAYENFPESMYQNVDGKKITMGGPANLPTGGWPGLCMDNPEVSKLVCSFIYELSKHYADNDIVTIIDVWNEPHLEPSYFCKGELICACDSSKLAFREWLKQKYGTLAALNAAWFRNYTNWDHILPPPRFGTYTDMLDWKRFWVDNTTKWLREKVAAAKRGAPNKIIQTHVACSAYRGSEGNGSLAYDVTDEYLLAKEVDLFGLSSFPKWQMGATPEEYHLAYSFHSESVASASRDKKFYQAELQGGAGVGYLGHRRPTKEDVRVWNWSTIASGGKGVVYWQFMPEPAGMEATGFGLVDLAGEDTDRSIEAGRCAALFSAMDLDNSSPTLSQNGILLSRNSDLFMFAAGCNEKKYVDSVFGIYTCCADAGIPVRIIHTDYLHTAWDEGLRYLYIPMALSLSQYEVEAILHFIELGGHVTMEAACGLFTEMGSCLNASPLLSQIFGATHISLDQKSEDVAIRNLHGDMLCIGEDYSQTMKIANGSPLGYFSDDSLAMAKATYGKGTCVWIGSFLGLSENHKDNSSTREIIKDCFSKVGYSIFSDLEADHLLVRILNYSSGYAVVAVNYTGTPRDLRITLNSGDIISTSVAPFDGKFIKI